MVGHAGLSRRHLLLVAAAGLPCGCATAPITGRRQIIRVSAEEENAVGAEIYRRRLAKEPGRYDRRHERGGAAGHIVVSRARFVTLRADRG